MGDVIMHKKIMAAVSESSASVAATVEMLTLRGIIARAIPNTLSPTYEERREHSDHGDIAMEVVCEAKESSYCFSGRHDWPFKDVLVDNKPAFDAKAFQPYQYIWWSNDLRAFVTINVSATIKTWYTTEMVHKITKIPGPCYMVARDLVGFTSLSQSCWERVKAAYDKAKENGNET